MAGDMRLMSSEVFFVGFVCADASVPRKNMYTGLLPHMIDRREYVESGVVSRERMEREDSGPCRHILSWKYRRIEVDNPISG